MRYRDFYHSKGKKGDYIILDNGAAEGAEFGSRHLFTIADMLGASEIIVPDVLGDKDETLSHVLAFNRYAHASPKPYRYMAVAQGQTISEVMESIHFYVETHLLGYVTCIGIPRLIATFAGKRARITIAELIEARGLNVAMEFHMLGATSWKEEAAELATIPWIRGIDTSMPIAMGLVDKNLYAHEYEPRPEDFFETVQDRPMVKGNIDIYLSWAKYDGT